MRTLILSVLLFSHSILFAQTNLISNGSFEIGNPVANWFTTASNGFIFAGQGACNASTGTNYAWAGDQTETNGINNLSENLFQEVSIPANATSVVLNFDASINTLESGGTVYDQMEIVIQNSSGTVLQTFGGLDNTDGDSGFGSCQTWSGWTLPIPPTYFGQTIRLNFEFSTDGSLPTIFRLDDVELLATLSGCSYSLNTNSYSLTSSAAGSFSNVASVTAPAGCVWNAQVTTGNSWLSTASSGSGNGSISITVTENTTLSPRTGTINVAGQTLTIEQPSVSCDYSLSQSTYNCPDHTAANWINIALVNVENGCAWDATVIEGTNWMVCNSDGNGNGTISIDVTANNTNQDRTGTVVVEGETLLVVQPVDFKLTGLNEASEAVVSIFPNPTNDNLTIQASQEFIGSNYQIVDWTGRVVLNGFISETNQNVDLNALSSGAYFISVKNASNSFSEKIIKL